MSKPSPVQVNRLPDNMQDSEQDWQSYFEELSVFHPVIQAEARDAVERLESALSLNSQMSALDFGCGFGFMADELASRVREVYLWDASENMRRLASRKVARHNNVRFLDLSTPDLISAEHSFDLILVNSVVQYMSKEDFSAWLKRWRCLLAPQGSLVISDIIMPGQSFLLDLLAYLVFGAREGFLVHTLWNTLKQFSRYLRVRRKRPLTRYSREELQEQASAAGLSVRFLPENITYRTRRLAAVLSQDDTKPTGARA